MAMDRRHCPLGGYSTPNDSSVKMGVRSGSLRTSRPALGSPIAGYARSHFGQKKPDSTELGRLLGYRGRRRPRMRASASGSRAIESLHKSVVIQYRGYARSVVRNRKPSQCFRSKRTTGSSIIAPRRRSSAHLHRPWRASRISAIDTKRRQFFRLSLQPGHSQPR